MRRVGVVSRAHVLAASNSTCVHAHAPGHSRYALGFATRYAERPISRVMCAGLARSSCSRTPRAYRRPALNSVGPSTLYTARPRAYEAARTPNQCRRRSTTGDPISHDLVPPCLPGGGCPPPAPLTARTRAPLMLCLALIHAPRSSACSFPSGHTPEEAKPQTVARHPHMPRPIPTPSCRVGSTVAPPPTAPPAERASARPRRHPPPQRHHARYRQPSLPPTACAASSRVISGRRACGPSSLLRAIRRRHPPRPRRRPEWRCYRRP